VRGYTEHGDTPGQLACAPNDELFFQRNGVLSKSHDMHRERIQSYTYAKAAKKHVAFRGIHVNNPSSVASAAAAPGYSSWE
jgi:hypothetical protein